MKSTQLLSVVFSLIMFTGISAGSIAYADEDLEDRLEEFCEITAAEQQVFFSDFPEMTEYDERCLKFVELMILLNNLTH